MKDKTGQARQRLHEGAPPSEVVVPTEHVAAVAVAAAVAAEDASVVEHAAASRHHVGHQRVGAAHEQPGGQVAADVRDHEAQGSGHEHLAKAAAHEAGVLGVLLLPELAAQLRIAVALDVVAGAERLAGRVEGLRRREAGQLLEPPAAQLAPKLIEQLRVRQHGVPLQGIAERGGHGAHRPAIPTAAVRAGLLVLASRYQDHVSGAVGRIVLLCPTSTLPGEGQVEARAAVTAIHDGGQLRSGRECSHDEVEYLVVHNHACMVEVSRAYGLVVPVLFAVARVLLLSSVAGVVEEEHIARPHVLDQPLEAPHDVVPRGLKLPVWAVVRQDQHRIRRPWKAVHPRQNTAHAVHVIDATPQFCRCSEVVDANKQGLLSARRRRTWLTNHWTRCEAKMLVVDLRWNRWLRLLRASIHGFAVRAHDLCVTRRNTDRLPTPATSNH
mmetsp:Transcript_11779/g.24426  ORF Transcript_11779/g.24426 Transcript_11779/m.24426 type:complete len:440 (-) Transcript_11779:339-1658(-)